MIEEIGYDYEVAFDFTAKSADKGSVLFKSSNAILYQSSPKSGKLVHFSNNPAVNRRVCEMTVRDLPFKNLVLNTSGIIRYPAAEALLALANGRLFSRGGTVRAERGRSRKG